MGPSFLYPIDPILISYPRTVISKAGTVRHIGQFFFDDEWNDQVLNTTVYAMNKQSRTRNDQDSILAEENSDGNNAFVRSDCLPFKV